MRLAASIVAVFIPCFALELWLLPFPTDAVAGAVTVFAISRWMTRTTRARTSPSS